MKWSDTLRSVPTGSPVAGAVAALRNLATGVTATSVTTGADGTWTILGDGNPAPSQVQVTAPGGSAVWQASAGTGLAGPFSLAELPLVVDPVWGDGYLPGRQPTVSVEAGALPTVGVGMLVRNGKPFAIRAANSFALPPNTGDTTLAWAIVATTDDTGADVVALKLGSDVAAGDLVIGTFQNPPGTAYATFATNAASPVLTGLTAHNPVVVAKPTTFSAEGPLPSIAAGVFPASMVAGVTYDVRVRAIAVATSDAASLTITASLTGSGSASRTLQHHGLLVADYTSSIVYDPATHTGWSATVSGTASILSVASMAATSMVARPRS